MAARRKRTVLVQSEDGKGVSVLDSSAYVRRRLTHSLDGVITRLVELTRSDDHKVAVAAIKEVLDRSIGKAETATKDQQGSALLQALQAMQAQSAAQLAQAQAIKAAAMERMQARSAAVDAAPMVVDAECTPIVAPLRVTQS